MKDTNTLDHDRVDDTKESEDNSLLVSQINMQKSQLSSSRKLDQQSRKQSLLHHQQKGTMHKTNKSHDSLTRKL